MAPARVGSFDGVSQARVKEQRAGEWEAWQTSLHNPDFSAYARNCGALGIRVTDAAELDAALAEAVAHDGPAMVEVIADPTLV
jgi:thiamine pyrophosphate-dependent acetolactate synthase large subunit-like protein